MHRRLQSQVLPPQLAQVNVVPLGDLEEAEEVDVAGDALNGAALCTGGDAAAAALRLIGSGRFDAVDDLVALPAGKELKLLKNC